MEDIFRLRLPAAQPVEPEERPAPAASVRFGGDNDEPIMIAVVRAPVESAMAQDALAEAHIPAFIKRNTLGSVYGLSVGSFGSAEVWVPPAAAEHARDVLIGLGLLPSPEDEAATE